MLTCIYYFLSTGLKILQASRGVLQYQLRYILFGFLSMGILLFINNVIMVIFGKMSYASIGIISIFFLLMSVSYAIIRHHFLGATVFVKKSSILGSLAMVLTTCYLFLLFLVQNFLEKFLILYPNFIHTGIAILMFISIIPFFHKIKQFLSYFFLTKEQELEQECEYLATTVVRMLDFEEVMLFLTNELELILRAKNVTIIVWDDKIESLRMETSIKNTRKIWNVPIHYRDSLFQLFNTCQSPALIDVFESQGQTKFVKKMENIQSKICIPFYVDGKCKGIIGIGERIRGEYSNDEIEILQKYAKDFGLAIDNSLKILNGNEFVEIEKNEAPELMVISKNNE
jgi:hypothetical protein